MTDGMTCGCVLVMSGVLSEHEQWEEEILTSNGDVSCADCHEVIPVGVKYIYVSILFDNYWEYGIRCIGCNQIANDLYCSGIPFPGKSLEDDIWDYLGVNIRTGETVDDDE